MHDPVIDGAEINAALVNTETIIDAACQTLSDVTALSSKVTTETDQIDDTLENLAMQVQIETDQIDESLDAGFCESSTDFTSTCSLRSQITTLSDTITARFDRLEALLNARLDRTDELLGYVRRILITPNGQRPGWNDEESCSGGDSSVDCPIPPLLPTLGPIPPLP